MPVWHQIELALLREIESGHLPAGSRLPNESDLAARFGVHRHTARRALATLAERGAVSIKRGRGTFVEAPLLTYPVTERMRFTAALLEQGLTAEHQLLESGEAPAPDPVASRLGLQAGAPVIALRLLGLAGGIPLNVGTTWLDATRFPDFGSAYAACGSLTKALARFGTTDFYRATTLISVALPTDEEAQLLRQSRRAPVISVESVDVDAAGRPIATGCFRFAGERVQFRVDRPGA